MTNAQIEAYLFRISCKQPIPLTVDGLNQLLWAHLKTVPFENLDIFDGGRIPSLQLDHIFEKVVTKGHGGYCFELNKLFYHLLLSLGFQAYPITVRILWQKPEVPPLIHRATIVTIDGIDHYCDVGYGGPAPRGAVALVPAVQTIHDESYQVIEEATGRQIIQKWHHNQWCDQFAFYRQAAIEADFTVMNFYCAKEPSLVFLQHRLVNLCTETGNLSLRDSVLTIRHDHTVTTTTYTSAEAIGQCCATYFGMVDVPPISRNPQG